MGEATEQEIAKRVFKRIRKPIGTSRSKQVPNSGGWRDVPGWHDDIRKLIGGKIKWNPLEYNLAGSRLELHTPKGWREAAIFVYEVYRLVCPTEIDLVTSKVDPSKLNVQEYIQFFSELIKKHIPTDMLTHYEASVGKDIEMYLKAEYKVDLMGIEDVFGCSTKILLSVYEDVPAQDDLVRKSMLESGYSYKKIVKLITWAIEYIAYIYDFSSDQRQSELMEMEMGIDDDGCQTNMLKMIELIKEAKERVDFDETDFWEWLEELEGNDDNDIDSSFIYLLRCRSEQDHTSYQMITGQYGEMVTNNRFVYKAQQKMTTMLSKGLRLEYYENFYRIGGFLVKWLTHMKANLVMNVRVENLTALLVEEIEKVRKDRQLLHYFLIESQEDDSGIDESACSLTFFRDRIRQYYNIFYESSYYDDWRMEHYHDMIWKDGADLFEEICADGFQIRKINGTYRYEKINQEYKKIWKYIDVFSESALVFMNNFNELYSNEKNPTRI